jgi:hypothetical protein
MSITVDKTRTPIKVTGTTSASEAITVDPVYIKHIYWHAPATIGDICSLKDRVGKDIVVLTCEVALSSQIFPLFTRFEGVYCDDFDSGTLYIYH